MEGFDKEWTYTTAANPFATYTKLQPGSYVLRVKRTNEAGEWNEKQEFINLQIQPPFRMTNWFKGFIMLVVLTILLLIIRLKSRRERRLREQELNLSRLKNQLSQAELKALKAQLPP
ncbi:MAG: hypothetical protein GY765_32030 [bacterium]|nr:hypothetical protein [bacterium]